MSVSKEKDEGFFAMPFIAAVVSDPGNPNKIVDEATFQARLVEAGYIYTDDGMVWTPDLDTTEIRDTYASYKRFDPASKLTLEEFVLKMRNRGVSVTLDGQRFVDVKLK